jgi:glucose-1-phosphate thymidylyltransferase
VKGLILAGGRGTRLRPLTFTRAKQLIPIANKPNLFYAVDDLVQAGVWDIGVIVSPETGDEVRAALGDGSRWGAAFTFITQDEPLGLAHAVRTAEDYLGTEPFVMYLGDNLLSGGIAHLIEEYGSGEADAIVLLTPVDDPSRFGVAELDSAGRVVRLVEKPQDPPSNLALVGVYLFGPCIHESVAELRPSWRGEYEITDAIQGLIDTGKRVVAHEVRGWWKDTGRPEDLIDANRLVLSQITRDVRGDICESRVDGEVVVEEGARVARSTVRGPVHIAAGALVEESYVGPYTSIGRDARIVRSEVECSIILDRAEIRDLPQLMDESVVGHDAVVRGTSDALRKRTLQLAVGDSSRVIL